MKPPMKHDETRFPVLIDERTLLRRIRELAEDVRRAGEAAPYPIAVLDGARIFADALCRCWGRPGAYDTIKAASYGAGTVSSGRVEIVREASGDLRGRRVVLVEDIVDTGRTVAVLIDHLRARGAASVDVCTLLSKPARRIVAVPLTWIGFEIPDKFVVGYGMDLDGRYRELPYVGVYSREMTAV
jgi:hypoxanthine phosphoribosyltransferase